MSKALNYTERYEESYISPAQDRIKKKKVTLVKSDMKIGASTESLDSIDGAAPVGMATRDEVLQSLGYKLHKVLRPTTNTTISSSNRLCHNCNKRVYPVEKVDVGELYHKGCFKCHICGLQLTLKTFCKVTQNKNIYCRNHVPKLESSYDKEAVQIKTELEAQKSSSHKLLRKYEPSSNNYDPGALEFQHARKMKKSAKVKKRKSLKTAKDFLRFGVFEAQEELEKQHREEEDLLYSEFQEERKSQLRKLEKELAAEREKTVKELITWFETQKKSESEKHSGIEKLEQYYKEHKETKMKDLLDKLHLEEQEAVARLTHKHAQEMLFMIERKDQEVGNSLSEMQEQFKRQTSEKEIEFPNNKHADAGKDNEEEDDEKNKEEDDDQEEEEEEEQEEEEEEQEEEEEEQEEEEEEEEEEEKEEQKITKKNETNENAKPHKNDFIEWNEGVKEENNEKVGEAAKKKEIIVGMREQLHRRNETLQLADHDDLDRKNYKKLITERVDVSFKNKKNAEMIRSSPKKQPQQDEDTMQENRKKMLEGWGEHGESDGRKESDGELESVEERIKKVLKKQKVGLSGTTLEEEFELNAQGVAFERASNIWKTASKNENRKSRRKHEEEEEEDEFLGISVAPEAAPPLCRKSKLYKDPSIFEQLDRSAYEESKRDPTSFTDLVRRLTMQCKTDLQKVRAIFRWITAKDLNKLKISEDTTVNTPMGLLRGIQTGTESYHNLFKRLCSYVAIHCEIINGFSKGVGYKPGSKFKDSRFRNQWTAVWIKDSWRFVNCNWGARHVKQVEDQKLTYKIDEFYFLTDPEDHIKQHFPDNEKWQLLRHPFTLEDFVRMPVVKSPFFNNQLKFEGTYESIMRASVHGYIEVKIRIPHLMSFASKLESSKVPSQKVTDCSVTRIVSNLVIFSATLPRPGKYFWDIYVDKKCGSKSLDNACSFMIYCSENPHYTYKSVCYPQTAIFGITQDGIKHDLRFEGDHDSFVTAKEELNLKFGIPFTSSTKYYLQLLCHNPQLKKKDYSGFAMIRGRTDSMLNCHLRFPFKGFYTFNLSVSDFSHSDSKKVLYNCLISCKKPSENQKILPYSTSKWRNCWLVEPMDGELAINTDVSFVIESKSVEELVVKVNEDWFQMRKNNNQFRGVVNTGNKPGKVEIFGKYSSKRDKYTPFLNYSVVQPSLTQQVNTLYKYI